MAIKGRRCKTHDDKHPIDVLFPTACHLTVLFTGPTEIHREQSFRTIGKVGLSRQAVMLLRKCNGWVTVAIYKRE